MELLRALEPEFEKKEEDIVRHDYRVSQAVAMEKVSEMEMLRRFEKRESWFLRLLLFR